VVVDHAVLPSPTSGAGPVSVPGSVDRDDWPVPASAPQNVARLVVEIEVAEVVGENLSPYRRSRTRTDSRRDPRADIPVVMGGAERGDEVGDSFVVGREQDVERRHSRSRQGAEAAVPAFLGLHPGDPHDRPGHGHVVRDLDRTRIPLRNGGRFPGGRSSRRRAGAAAPGRRPRARHGFRSGAGLAAGPRSISWTVEAWSLSARITAMLRISL